MEKLHHASTYFPSFCTRKRWREGGALKFDRTPTMPTGLWTRALQEYSLPAAPGHFLSSRRHLFSLLFLSPLFILNTYGFVVVIGFFVYFTGAATYEVSVAEEGNLLPADHSLFQLLSPCRCPRALVLWHQDLPQLHGLQSHLGRVGRGNSSGFGWRKASIHRRQFVLDLPGAFISWSFRKPILTINRSQIYTLNNKL